MPGTNHQVEMEFLNRLPLELRPAADDLLRHNTLKQLILMRHEGVNEFLRKRFYQLSEVEWVRIINTVILTKISYFEINKQFSVEQLDKLIEIALDALDMPQQTPVNLYRMTEKRYPVFANVIKLCIQYKKYLTTQHQVSSA
jgi:hypothetical protein